MERVEVDRGVHLYRRSASGPWWDHTAQERRDVANFTTSVLFVASAIFMRVLRVKPS